MGDFEKKVDFIGDVSVKNIRCSFDELLVEARDIRKRLGSQAYLLDKYLTYLMESANNSLAYESGSEGFDGVCNLRMLCIDIIRREKRNIDHPFYEQAKTFIEAHPLDCLEVQTKESLYIAMLSEDYFEAAATKFFEEQKNSLARVLDIIDFQHLHKNICELLGGEDAMKNIDRMFRQCFLLTTPMACYLQGMANGLLYELTSRDRETSQLVFQLLLDSGA
jgi:hypothetical protein